MQSIGSYNQTFLEQFIFYTPEIKMAQNHTSGHTPKVLSLELFFGETW